MKQGEQNKDWFRMIVEASPSAMLMVDGHGKITLLNRGAEVLFGYPREELLGQPIERLIPERFREHHPEMLHGFLEDPQPRPMGAGRSLFGLHKNGAEIPIEIGLNPLKDVTGEHFVLASVLDITPRRQNEEMFQRAVEAAPVGMAMISEEGEILLLNAMIERLFGYSKKELLGKSIDVLVPKRFREQHSKYRGGFFASPSHRSMGVGRDLFGLHKDGTEFPVEIGLAPLDTLNGRRVMASIIDITARKQYEEELQRSNADLEQFAYIASHDLQEPLRMVSSYTELLAQRYQGKLDEKADKFIFYAVDGAKRMQRLVADLLAYSRVGSQGKPLTEVSAQEVLSNVLSALKSKIEEVNATIESDPLPVVLADEVQIYQLFQNLIGNALKFHGSTPLHIKIKVELKNDRWLFSIQDNGIGIEMQYAERVFQMFQRLHERGKYEGSGIGLAIVKRIVERHGGKIWLSSQFGAGTTFFFTLHPARQK